MRRSSIMTAALALVAFGACDSVAPVTAGDAELAFAIITPAGSAVATIVVEVSGPGIDSQLIFNFTVTGNVASGTARVPAGSGRHVAARAFDAFGINTHRGDTTVTLVEGANPGVSLTLRPLTGDQPLILTFGSNIVSINRQDTTLTAGDTLHLTATAINWRAALMPPDSIVWASSNPAVAAVSAGIVTALVPGTANIVASFDGAAARRIIAVVAGAPPPPPPPLPVPGDLIITEVMARPTVGDAVGEWFEVINVSGQTVSLSGLEIRSGLESFIIPAGHTLASGAYAVFGINGTLATNGGVVVTVVYSGILLANASDDLALYDGATLLDMVSWATAPPLGSSRTLMLSKYNTIDNDNQANWCVSTPVYGTGDHGTPGSGDPACP